jgi:hypothetical protein
VAQQDKSFAAFHTIQHARGMAAEFDQRDNAHNLHRMSNNLIWQSG